MVGVKTLCVCVRFSAIQCVGSECIWEAEQSRRIRHGHGWELRYSIQMEIKKSITVSVSKQGSRLKNLWFRLNFYHVFIFNIICYVSLHVNLIFGFIVFFCILSHNLVYSQTFNAVWHYFFFLSYTNVFIIFQEEKVMPDKDLTCDLFRFLQLLCEGHNSGNLSNELTDVLLYRSWSLFVCFVDTHMNSHSGLGLHGEEHVYNSYCP